MTIHQDNDPPCPSCGHDPRKRGPRDCKCCWTNAFGQDVRKGDDRPEWRKYKNGEPV